MHSKQRRRGNGLVAEGTCSDPPHVRSMRVASLVVATSLFVGWADEPPPPPREFLEGRVQAISRQDRREILALAKKELIRTGRASHPIYCIYVERSDLVYVYHGEERKRADDVEEALIVERVHGHWQLGEREIVRAALGVCGGAGPPLRATHPAFGRALTTL